MSEKEQGIQIEELPKLNNPILIAGFDGWGNALDISNGMSAYLIRKLKAEYFAKINPDIFYRYDENRPLVNIKGGNLISLSPLGGSFYAARNDKGMRDLIILKANEPHLRWVQFVDDLLTLCENLSVETVITLGSMYDSVLHTDRIVSGISSNKDLFLKLKQKNIIPIDYQGPTAIHTLIHSEAQKRGMDSISLWSHCPYYLQDTTHFGILFHLGALLSFLGNFELDTKDLEAGSEALNEQIQLLINKNPKLQTIIEELKEAKVRGSWESVKASIKKGEKVIDLKDFFEAK